MKVHERKNSELIKEFNRYVRERPGFADAIPKNAEGIFYLSSFLLLRSRSTITSHGFCLASPPAPVSQEQTRIQRTQTWKSVF